MNTDQDSQSTGFEWTNTLSDAKVKISMDGRGRWIDNRMIERLWRSLKYECVYLNAFSTGSEARAGIGKWLTYYNAERPHSTHGILTPNEAYDNQRVEEKKAALNETKIDLKSACKLVENLGPPQITSYQHDKIRKDIFFRSVSFQ